MYKMLPEYPKFLNIQFKCQFKAIFKTVIPSMEELLSEKKKYVPVCLI